MHDVFVAGGGSVIASTTKVAAPRACRSPYRDDLFLLSADTCYAATLILRRNSARFHMTQAEENEESRCDVGAAVALAAGRQLDQTGPAQGPREGGVLPSRSRPPVSGTMMQFAARRSAKVFGDPRAAKAPGVVVDIGRQRDQRDEGGRRHSLYTRCGNVVCRRQDQCTAIHATRARGDAGRYLARSRSARRSSLHRHMRSPARCCQRPSDGEKSARTRRQ